MAIFNRYHPMQRSKATKIQRVTDCQRIRDRNITNEREEK